MALTTLIASALLAVCDEPIDPTLGSSFSRLPRSYLWLSGGVRGREVATGNDNVCFRPKADIENLSPPIILRRRGPVLALAPHSICQISVDHKRLPAAWRT